MLKNKMCKYGSKTAIPFASLWAQNILAHNALNEVKTMLNKRLFRILLSLVLTVGCLALYYILVYDIGETTGSHTGIPAVFTALLAFAVLDFFFVLILDQGEHTSRSGAKFKNGLYKLLVSLEFMLGAMVVLCGAIDYTDVTHSDMQASTLMFVAGFVGMVIVHCTVKIAVYHSICHGKLPKVLFPFVHVCVTLMGYVVGVLVSCLGLLAPFLYGIANVVVFIVAVVVFCKRGYFDAGITEGYNSTTYLDDSPFDRTPTKRPQKGNNTPKKGNNNPKKKNTTRRKTLNTFEKSPVTSQRSRNSLAYNEIERRLRAYLPTISKTLSANFPLESATIKVTHLWEDVGYNIIVRFHISYNTTSDTMQGYEMESWGNAVSEAILAFRNSFECKIDSYLQYVYDIVDSVVQADDPYYLDNWQIDCDFAEDLVID